jgi:hypothetical protein
VAGEPFLPRNRDDKGRCIPNAPWKDVKVLFRIAVLAIAAPRRIIAIAALVMVHRLGAVDGLRGVPDLLDPRVLGQDRIRPIGDIGRFAPVPTTTRASHSGWPTREG